jgi:outer membrane protein OmpA-like peptidoglycan-associated protein
MSLRRRVRQLRTWCYLACAVLLTGVILAAPLQEKLPAGKKERVKGTIMSRSGDLVKVREKSGNLVMVDLTEDTKIERDQGAKHFYRHEDMDATAMVPGLTIDAEGVGNAKGQLEANKITFNPDEFAIEAAEEKQIEANQATAKKAQAMARTGVAEAGKPQQESAAADAIGMMDAEAVMAVNKRVSDLGDYKTVAEAALYFPPDGATLDDAAKADLDLVASTAKPLDGYMIEIAGYASSTGTREEDQKISEERASAVAQYLRDRGNIPMRRIVVPAGYGATRAAATNTDSQGRAMNRRVDVKVFVNKGLSESE